MRYSSQSTSKKQRNDTYQIVACEDEIDPKGSQRGGDAGKDRYMVYDSTIGCVNMVRTMKTLMCKRTRRVAIPGGGYGMMM